MTREEIERTVYEAIEASQPVGPESAPAYFRRCDALAKKATDLILSDRAGEGGNGTSGRQEQSAGDLGRWSETPPTNSENFWIGWNSEESYPELWLGTVYHLAKSGHKSYAHMDVDNFTLWFPLSLPDSGGAKTDAANPAKVTGLPTPSPTGFTEEEIKIATAAFLAEEHRQFEDETTDGPIETELCVRAALATLAPHPSREGEG